MDVNNNPSVEEFPATHSRSGPVRVNDHNGPEAKGNDVVNRKIMPDLLTPWWDLEEDCPAGTFMGITHHLNANPVSFTECNKSLNLTACGFDTWGNQGKIMMQHRRTEGIWQEEGHRKLNLIAGSLFFCGRYSTACQASLLQ